MSPKDVPKAYPQRMPPKDDHVRAREVQARAWEVHARAWDIRARAWEIHPRAWTFPARAWSIHARAWISHARARDPLGPGHLGPPGAGLGGQKHPFHQKPLIFLKMGGLHQNGPNLAIFR